MSTRRKPILAEEITTIEIEDALEAFFLARGNHTGTQLLSTISDAGALAALSAIGNAYITDVALGKVTGAGALAALSAIGNAYITDVALAKVTGAGTLASKNNVSQSEINTSSLKPRVDDAITVVTSVLTGTNTIPFDDTIPQNTEGDEYITVTYTPKNSANKLIVEGLLFFSNNSGNTFAVSLFKDSEASARAAAYWTIGAANWQYTMPIYYEMTAGTTSAITFKVRAGLGGAGTTTLNGYGGGTRRYGGVLRSFLKVTEVMP